jgi:hypothetical protein
VAMLNAKGRAASVRASIRDTSQGSCLAGHKARPKCLYAARLWRYNLIMRLNKATSNNKAHKAPHFMRLDYFFVLPTTANSSLRSLTKNELE